MLGEHEKILKITKLKLSIDSLVQNVLYKCSIVENLTASDAMSKYWRGDSSIYINTLSNVTHINTGEG